MILSFPWPDSKLNPNRIVHYHVRAKIKAAYKADCYLIAKAAAFGHEFLAGSMRLSLLFMPPDRRSRDLDNLLASMKSGLDGISLAFGVNDKLFRPITVDFGDITKNGLVKISFDQDQRLLTSNSESHSFV